MKRSLVVVMMAVLLTFAYSCGNANEDHLITSIDTDSASIEESVAEIAAEEIETFSFSVCGLELKYPMKWKDTVLVSVAGDRACFTYGEISLFDLTFNSDEGNVLGTVKSERGNTVVRIVNYPIETENENLYLMKEDINVTLQYLNEDYDFVPNEVIMAEDDSVFDIITPIATLKYPNKWKDTVDVEVLDYQVSFSNNGTPLFDIVYTECDGYLFGRYNNYPVYIVDYLVNTEEQEKMKEDVNVILDNLMKDGNFVVYR